GETVTISFRTAEDTIIFMVHNPGYIPRDIQLQIFKRSFSTKDPSRGLGTYSVKLLTEHYLKGKVSFCSDPVNGTIFSITLPLNAL
ncbi:MAG: ATP-binding protein, partial [Bacteroidales bacterium]|nr:ATP-binding protein [Bacteroidales bacterium]